MRTVWLYMCLTGCLAWAGCQTLHTASTRPATLQHKLASEQLVVHSDFPLAEDHRLIDELTAQRDWLTDKLRLAKTDVPIHVYLYSDEQAYHEFVKLRYPGFAERRAIFVEDYAALSVYAHWGDHVADDLRHEVSHGYLHAAVPNLPLWLDEGLAEYFEVGLARRGMNGSHLEFLRQRHASGEWQPNMNRLEQISSAVEMTQADYSEAWAWVHFLLESGGDKAEVLTDYLNDLQHGGAGALLSTRVRKRLAGPNLALVEYLETLR
jgi:hypothetical protein